MKLTGLKGTIGFVFSGKAVETTMLLFGIIFLVNFLLSLCQIHVSQPVELLHGGVQGEQYLEEKQVVMVFFLPLAVAVMHTMAAFPFTKRIMAMLNFPDSNMFLVATGITIVVFTVVYLTVYALTARAYYKIVE